MLTGRQPPHQKISSGICRSKMRQLVCVCLDEGWAGRGARDVGAASREFCEPIEPIDEAQHIRHENVGYGEGPDQPFASVQDRFHVLEPGLKEGVKKLSHWRFVGVT